MAIRSHRDLLVWQKAMTLAELTYQVSQKFPASELYGLTSQARRSAISIPANIAEGHGRSMPNSFQHFLAIAHGSLMELETHVELAARLSFCTQEEMEALLRLTQEVGRMLQGLRRSLRETSTDP